VYPATIVLAASRFSLIQAISSSLGGSIFCFTSHRSSKRGEAVGKHAAQARTLLNHVCLPAAELALKGLVRHYVDVEGEACLSDLLADGLDKR
jgi:hypothetical protein